MLSFLEEKKLYELSKNIISNINVPKNFENISSLLQNKSFIKNNQEFLKLININLNQYQIRIFLSSIMINFCPNDILQEIKEIEEKLMSSSLDLYQDYLNILNNPSENYLFTEKIYNYLQIFEIWKDQDKKKFIFLLSSTYNELIMTSKMIETKNSIDAEIWLKEIENQKKLIEKSVYQIAGEEGIEKMLNGTFWIDVITPEFRILIENNLKKSFRNKLLLELNNEIPFTIIKCLKEIENHYLKNYPDIHKKLRIELLNNQLDKNDKKNIINYNLQIFMKIENIKNQLDNDEQIIDILINIYQNIGK